MEEGLAALETDVKMNNVLASCMHGRRACVQPCSDIGPSTENPTTPRVCPPGSPLDVPQQAQAEVHRALLLLRRQAAARAVLVHRSSQGPKHSLLCRGLGACCRSRRLRGSRLPALPLLGVSRCDGSLGLGTPSSCLRILRSCGGLGLGLRLCCSCGSSSAGRGSDRGCSIRAAAGHRRRRLLLARGGRVAGGLPARLRRLGLLRGRSSGGLAAGLPAASKLCRLSRGSNPLLQSQHPLQILHPVLQRLQSAREARASWRRGRRRRLGRRGSKDVHGEQQRVDPAWHRLGVRCRRRRHRCRGALVLPPAGGRRRGRRLRREVGRHPRVNGVERNRGKACIADGMECGRAQESRFEPLTLHSGGSTAKKQGHGSRGLQGASFRGATPAPPCDMSALNQPHPSPPPPLGSAPPRSA